jgi:hypothetical protein
MPHRLQQRTSDAFQGVIHFLNRLSGSFGPGIDRFFQADLYGFRFTLSTFNSLTSGLQHGSGNAFQEVVHFMNHLSIFWNDLRGGFRLIQSTFNAF